MYEKRIFCSFMLNQKKYFSQSPLSEHSASNIFFSDSVSQSEDVKGSITAIR